MEINPVFAPPPPPPPPKPAEVVAPAVTPAGRPAAGMGGDRLAVADDPFADPFSGAEPFEVTLADPAAPPVPANGSRLVAIAGDQAFVEQAFVEMFGHPVVTPEELAAAQADPTTEHAKNVLWRESLVRDNLAHLQGYMAAGQAPEQARRTLIEGLMQTDEFRLRAGLQANQMDLGIPITLVGPGGQPIPFLWTSQHTTPHHGDRPHYYGGDGLPLDRPLSFDEGNRFLENFICNGTSAYDMMDARLATTPQERALAQLGSDLYAAYWGRKDGDDQGRWTTFLAGKKAEIDDLVGRHPELAPRAAETQAVLAAGVAFMAAVKDGGRAPLLQSVPGATVGFYMSGPKNLDPRGPVDERVVPEEPGRPRYAQINDHYARQTYAQQAHDPRSPVGSWIASWRA